MNKFICAIVSYSTYKWYHMIFFSLWLHSVWQSITISRSIHVAAHSIFRFFYVWVICHVYMYHMFFIISSADGYLDCFHVLNIVKSAAVNIGVHISLWIMVFSGYMPRNGLAGSYGRSIFSFLRNLLVAILIYISTSSVGGFPFLCTVSSIYEKKII